MLVGPGKVYVSEDKIGDSAQGSKQLDFHICFLFFSVVILKNQIVFFFFFLKLRGLDGGGIRV